MQQLHPPLDNQPVLSRQRHNVRNRSDCYQVPILVKHHLIVRAFECASQLEGYAHSCQILAPAFIVQPVRVDDRNRPGQNIARLMMVGNDHIQTDRNRIVNLLERGHPIIDRHNQ